MIHPFDDFLPPAWHQEREDRRVIRIGVILVAVVSISIAAAYASSMNGWNSLLKDSASIEVRWNDAQERIDAYLESQKVLEDSIETAKNIEQYTDGIPRSLLLWELTQLLPEYVRLDDVRLETRRRTNEDDELEVIELITLLGVSPSDASISTYIAGLSSSHFFSEVSLMYAQENKDGEKRDFSVQMKVRARTKLAMEPVE